jgi:hypothetical protein
VFELVGSWIVSIFGENTIGIRIISLICLAVVIGIVVGIPAFFSLLAGLCE